MLKQVLLSAVCFLVLNSSTAQTAKTALQFYEEGIKLQDSEKYTDALVSFKKAIAKNPNYKEAIYSAGWTCNELKKYTEAITYLEKAKALWPTESKIYLELGYANDKLANKTVAIANYNKCISLKDDYALAYKYLGIIYYDDEDYKKALENLESFIKYEPDTKDDDVYYRKAVSENDQDKTDDALISINKANELNPNNVKFLNELGYTYYALKKADEALNYYDQALAIDAKSQIALNGRGNVYRKLKKDPAEAIKLYAKTLEVNSDNTNASYWTGWCYNDLEKYADAIPFLKKVIELDNQYVSAYTELGYSDYSLKNYDDALTNFKKALTIDKTELSLYYSGLCYIKKNQKSEALKMIVELKKMESEYVEELQQLIDKM